MLYCQVLHCHRVPPPPPFPSPVSISITVNIVCCIYIECRVASEAGGVRNWQHARDNVLTVWCYKRQAWYSQEQYITCQATEEEQFTVSWPMFARLVSHNVKKHKDKHTWKPSRCMWGSYLFGLKCSSSSGFGRVNWRWKQSRERAGKKHICWPKVVWNRIVNKLPHKPATAAVYCVSQYLSSGAVGNSWMI